MEHKEIEGRSAAQFECQVWDTCYPVYYLFSIHIKFLNFFNCNCNSASFHNESEVVMQATVQ